MPIELLKQSYISFPFQLIAKNMEGWPQSGPCFVV